MGYSKAVSRLCTRLQPLSLKCSTRRSVSFSPDSSSFLKSQSPASSKRIPRISRLPVELSALVTMMPLHSAIASARLKSSLSVESQSWGIVPQGISMPL